MNNKIKIKINKTDLEEDEFSEVFSFNNLTIIEKNGDEHVIETPVVLNVNKQTLDILKYYDNDLDAYIIHGEQEKNIFFYVMDNIELASSLNATKDILDKNEFLENHTMFETINEMLRLIEESEIVINSVHLELILRCLTIMDKRIAFENKEFPEYKMYRIKEAILRGKSLSKSITFEELNKQLSTLSYDIYDKGSDSLLDGLL